MVSIADSKSADQGSIPCALILTTNSEHSQYHYHVHKNLTINFVF